MKLTLANIKNLKRDATPLQKRVCNYVINEWHDYDDKKNIFTDVLNYGCQSGTVGFLIYYNDKHGEFFTKETKYPYIACCPNCAAMFNEHIVNCGAGENKISDMINKIETNDTIKKQTEMNL